MASKKSQAKIGAIDYQRVIDWSDGMNNAVNAALLKDSESVLLQNASLDQKGTLFSRKGRVERYSPDISPTGSVAGMAPYYKSDGTSRLLIGASDGKLYTDKPHIINSYDTQGEFNNGKYQATVATADGKVWPMIVSTGFEDGYFTDFHTKDSGWTIDTAVYKTGAKSAKGTGTNQKLIREFGFNASQAYVKLACRFAETNQVHYPVILLSPTGTQIQAVVADSDGNFKYHNGTALTAFPTAKTYTANTWYVVEVWVRGGTFWVSIDGVSLTPSGLAMKDTANAAQTQVAKVQIQNAGSTAATMWVDDVEINALAAVFSRDSVAYTSTGAQVAANVPRYEAGKFSQALEVEEGTTNVFTSPQDLTVYFFKSSAITITANVEGNADKVSATSFAEYIKQEITADGGPLSFTVIAKKGTATTIDVRLYDYTAGAYIAQNNNVTLDTQYKAISVSVASTVNGHVIRPYIWFTTGDTIVLGLQMERKPYATSFIDGIRSVEVPTIPTAGVLSATQGTLECWIRLDDDVSSVTHAIFDARDGAATNPDYTGPHMYVGTDGKVYFRVGTGNYYYELLGTTVLTKGTWYFMAFRWSSAGTALLVNGAVETSSTTPPSWALPATAYIGCNYLGKFQLDGLIDDLRISSRARTDAEISAAYSSGVALPVDADTTYKLPLDGNLTPSATYTWISPVIDASNATDKASGHAALTADVPGGSTISIQSRSAPASTGPWTAWVNALADGTLQHTADNFVQVRLILTRSGEDDPDVDKLVVSFDGTPAATLLASDFTAGGQFYFDTLLDNAVIVNGIDAPRKYDGTTVSLVGGSPPHGRYLAAHKNRMWIAGTTSNPSRLYFSDILNIDSWPVLNFIDIAPNDGDVITGIMPLGDYLVISKGHSVWLLTGEGVNTFSVRRIHADRGAYAPRSIVTMNGSLCFVSDDGVYLSDLTQAVLISERVKETWAGLNLRRINQAANWFDDHKLYVAVPSAGSTINDTIIVFDSLRQSFAGIITGWKASCWCYLREAGKIVSLYGHSDKVQVSEINNGFSDNGLAIPFIWKSKEFNFGTPESYKRWNKVYMEISPANTQADLTITFFVDGQQIGSTTVAVPLGNENIVYTILALASRAGVIGGHRLALQVAQSVLNNPVGIQLLSIEYMTKGVKPAIYS